MQQTLLTVRREVAEHLSPIHRAVLMAGVREGRYRIVNDVEQVAPEASA